MMERYTKQEKAGQGTYGVVYKSWDNETNEFVALKVSRQKWAGFTLLFPPPLSLNLGCQVASTAAAIGAEGLAPEIEGYQKKGGSSLKLVLSSPPRPHRSPAHVLAHDLSKSSSRWYFFRFLKIQTRHVHTVQTKHQKG